MKKKIVVLLMLAVVLTTTVSFAAVGNNGAKTLVAFEKADFSDATVTASILNVREGPSTDYPSICKLEKGQQVKIIGKLGSWYAIYDMKDGHVGAVDGRYVKAAVTAVPASKDTSAGGAASSDTASKTDETVAQAIPSGISQDEETLFKLVNKARKDAKVGELAFDEELEKLARLKVKDMADNNYFSHQSPTYGSPFDMMKQFDSSFKTAGENIAGNQTVEGAFKAWMASDTHKKNILNRTFD